MFAELKERINREAYKGIYECMCNVLHNKEACDCYTEDKQGDPEIAEIADSLPITDEVERPDVIDVIENLIPMSKI